MENPPENSSPVEKPRGGMKNPFYPLLVAVGLVFAFTACCYGVLMVNLLDPTRSATLRESGTGLLLWLDQYGMWAMGAELALLGLLTAAAIGTDDYWPGEKE